MTLANQIAALSAAATLEKWLAGTPIYEGDDARSVHYRDNRKALETALAALNAQAEVEALRSEAIDLQATIVRLTRELGEARVEGAKAMQSRAINHCKASAHNTRLDVIIERYGDEATQYAADLLNAVADELSRVDPIAIARHEHRKDLSHD